MIRRVLVFLGIAASSAVLLAGPASAGTNVACVWNVSPTNVGLCLSV